MKAASSRGLAPPEVVVPGEDPVRDEKALELGEKLLRQGKVGCLLVAGGQGTRLGISIPKGMLEVGGKSLFQRFAESIRSLQKKYRRPIFLYVMTSFATNAETIRFFREKRHFGLSPEQILFFEQGSSPTKGMDGRSLRGADGQTLRNPDGHGGMLQAARRAKIFAHARKNGAETIFYFQVDNPLVEICDPLFLGLHRLRSSEYSLKIVRKGDPDEKLGIVCVDRGRHRLVEYSELPKSLRHAHGPEGRLCFDAGSIAVHAFDLAFLEREARRRRGLPWHRARKTVRALDPKGRLVEVDGIKSERFIFDVLPRAKNPLILETSREREFAPIKNASGPDSLKTAQAALARRARNG